MCGFMSQVGWLVSTKFFNPVLVMNCGLMSAFISQMFGVWFGIDETPGILTVTGVILIILSVNFIQNDNTKESSNNYQNAEIESKD